MSDWRLTVYARGGGASEGVRRSPQAATKRRRFKAQGGRCLYCLLPIGTRIRRGARIVALTAHWDHFVPFAYLAQNPDANWVLSCQVCNAIKSERIFTTLETAREAILPRRITKGYETPEETLARIKPQRRRAKRAAVKAAAAKPRPTSKPPTRVPAPRKPLERTLPKGAVSHGCGAWWTGGGKSHCAGCCQTFATERTALLHRVGDGSDRRCLPPREAGLVPVSHPWGTCWTKPKP